VHRSGIFTRADIDRIVAHVQGRVSGQRNEVSTLDEFYAFGGSGVANGPQASLLA
jgi:hypothetical protein